MIELKIFFCENFDFFLLKLVSIKFIQKKLKYNK